MSDDTPTTTEAPDDPPTATAPSEAGDDQPREESDTAAEGEGDIHGQMVRYAQWAAFAFLLLVALIATVRLYFAAAATIDTFVTRRFRPLFMAGFNLAVLLSCGIGLSVLLRRLT